MPDDQFELQRFLTAQADTYDEVIAELAAGRKASHWMWFIFPQVIGLGSSYLAERYAIRSSGEARAYLDHPVLGSRLVECAQLLLAHPDLTARDILGHPDDLKLRSSMTLFSSVADRGSVFEKVIQTFYAGAPDDATLAVLAHWSDAEPTD